MAYSWQVFEVHVLDWAWEEARRRGARSMSFTNKGVAARLECSEAQATRYIQNYLNAQRRKDSQTRYVLKRKGRTKRAVWSVGERTRDAHSLTAQLGSDIQRRIERAIEPDIRRIATLNPRAVNPILNGITPLIDGMVQMIQAVVATAKAAGGDSE